MEQPIRMVKILFCAALLAFAALPARAELPQDQSWLQELSSKKRIAIVVSSDPQTAMSPEDSALAIQGRKELGQSIAKSLEGKISQKRIVVQEYHDMGLTDFFRNAPPDVLVIEVSADAQKDGNLTIGALRYRFIVTGDNHIDFHPLYLFSFDKKDIFTAPQTTAASEKLADDVAKILIDYLP